MNGEAEGLVLAGDLTDHGLVDEAKTLAEALSGLRVPCAAVLGNHDFEGGAVKEIVRDPRARPRCTCWTATTPSSTGGSGSPG